MTDSADSLSSATLFQDHEEKLLSAKEIEDIFIIINPYSSYFNYELIEVIVGVHGTHRDKENMQLYCNDFSEYYMKCMKMPCVEFHEECSANESNHTKIKFKLDYDRNQLKFDDVKHIQHNIAEILNLKPSVLYLHCIEDGCVFITFLIPSFFGDYLMDLITKNRSALQNNVKLLHVEYLLQDSS